MFFTVKGLGTLVLCVAATTLSWVQLALPTWITSTSGIVQSVGLWGLCIANVCYPYFMPANADEMLNAVHGNASRLMIATNETICNVYTSQGLIGWDNSKQIASDSFLSATCGPLGQTSMAMCIIQAVLGTFMCVSYLLWTCARTNKSCLLALCKLLAFASLFANLLTITMWMVQKSNIHTNATSKDGLGFILTLVSCGIFGLCVILIGMLRLHEHHEKMKSLRELTKARSIKVSQKSLPINTIVAGTYEGMLYGWEASMEELLAKKAKLKMVYGYPAHVECIKSIAMMMENDGKTLLTGSTDEMIKIYNVKRKVEVGILMQHKGAVTCLEYYGKSHVLSGSADNTICIWRTSDWNCVHILGGHKGPINSIAVHPSGKLAFSVARDKTLRMWNLVKGRSAYIRRLDQEASIVFLSNDGNRYGLVMGRDVSLFGAANADLLAVLEHKKKVNTAAFATNDIVLCGLDDGSFYIHKASGGVIAEIRHSMLDARIRCMEIVAKPDDSKLPFFVLATSKGIVQVWDLADFKLEGNDLVEANANVEPIVSTKMYGSALVTALSACKTAHAHGIEEPEPVIEQEEKKPKKATNDDEFEVPTINNDKKPVMTNWDDEEEEEEAPAPVVAKPAAPTGPLKPKQIKKMMLKEQEEKHKLEVAIAKARAEEERNMTPDELKAKQQRSIEDADFENALDAFGLSNSNAVKTKVANAGDLDSIVTNMKLVSLADHEELGSLVGKRLVNSNAKYVVEFMKTLISHASTNLTANDMNDITTIINVIKNEKIAAAKPKGKKKKVTGKQGYAKVERTTAGAGSHNIDDYDYGDDDFDDFIWNYLPAMETAQYMEDFDTTITSELFLELEPAHTSSTGQCLITPVLVQVNQQWLHTYACYHQKQCLSDQLVARESLWLNDYFQKLRAIHDPTSAHAKLIIHKYHQTAATFQNDRVHDGSEYSTQLVEPLALILHCTALDRLPESRLVPFLQETALYLECNQLRSRANQASLASHLYRLLVARQSTEARVLLVRLLLKLAEDDATTVVRGCEIGAQGKAMLPNIFILTLPKRHPENSELTETTKRLLHIFDVRKSSFFLSTTPRTADSPKGSRASKKSPVILSSLSVPDFKLPEEIIIKQKSPYKENIRPKTTASSKGRRSMPLLPLAQPTMIPTPPKPLQLTPLDRIEERLDNFLLSPVQQDAKPYRTCTIPMPLVECPLQSPQTAAPTKHSSYHSKKQLHSVNSYQWWWRTLPENHASLTDFGKLKAVCSGALRLHWKGNFEQAAELYAFALELPQPSHIKLAQDEEDSHHDGITLAAKLHINHGSTLFEMKKYEESIAAFRSAIQLCPDHIQAHFQLALACEVAGHKREAIAELQAIAPLYPLALDRLNLIECEPSPKFRADHRLQTTIKNLASKSKEFGVSWLKLFRLVDCGNCDYISVNSFRDMLHLMGIELGKDEWRGVLRFLGDSRDINYIAYLRLVHDPIISHNSAVEAPVTTLDKVCFNGIRRRTGFERLRVPLHLLAQREAMDFFKSVTQWARFGVEKTIDVKSKAPPISSTWMPFVMQVPPYPTSIISSIATVLVTQSSIKGVRSAHRAIRLRRLVTRKVVETVVSKGVVYAISSVVQLLHDTRLIVAKQFTAHVLAAAVAKFTLSHFTTSIARATVSNRRKSLKHLHQRIQVSQLSLTTIECSWHQLIKTGNKARNAATLWRKSLIHLNKLKVRSTKHIKQCLHAEHSLTSISRLGVQVTSHMQQHVYQLENFTKFAQNILTQRRVAKQALLERVIRSKIAYYTIFHTFQTTISKLTGLPLPPYDLPWMFRKYEILPNDDIELPKTSHEEDCFMHEF
ncbi:p21-activated protein kinase-interacting protein, partial [Thraustotheca clavata]